jgi:hypothetical protein
MIVGGRVWRIEVKPGERTPLKYFISVSPLGLHNTDEQKRRNLRRIWGCRVHYDHWSEIGLPETIRKGRVVVVKLASN